MAAAEDAMDERSSCIFFADFCRSIMADSWRIHGGFMADSWRIHGGFMANGFAKVENGFG